MIDMSPISSGRRGARGPVDLGFAPTGAERRARGPVDLGFAPTEAERRQNPGFRNAPASVKKNMPYTIWCRAYSFISNAEEGT